MSGDDTHTVPDHPEAMLPYSSRALITGLHELPTVCGEDMFAISKYETVFVVTGIVVVPAVSAVVIFSALTCWSKIRENRSNIFINID